MDDEDQVSPHPGDQTHPVNRGAAHGDPEEATQSGNWDKGTFHVFSLFLPYYFRSSTFITLTTFLLCSGKGSQQGKSIQQDVPISKTASSHSKRKD